MMSCYSPSLFPSAGTNNNESDIIDGLFQNAVANNIRHNKNKGSAPMSKLPNPNQTEKLLAQEMNRLSIKEREKIYESIHGVAESFEEEPEFVAQRMEAMAQALQKIREKNAYDMAMTQSPTYVHSLYLQFLRSTDFDPMISASKLVLFLEVKLEFFGPELLGKHITYDDLSPSDKQCVQSGWHQILPFRDRGGRTVIWHNTHARRKDISPLSNTRAYYYLSTLIISDEETQKHGAVTVCFASEDDVTQPVMQEFCWKVARFMASLPLKIVSQHKCFDSKIPLALMCMAAFGKALRLCTRIHQGTLTENTYTLLTFGIPVAYAPMTNGNTVKLKYFRQWLSRQICLEQRRQTNSTPVDTSFFGLRNHNNLSPGIELPCCNDILLGTGAVAQNYSGNVQFLVLAAQYHERYSQSEIVEKKKIVEEVYGLLHSKEYSARFLMRSSPDDWWTIAPKEMVLKKIAHRIRAKQPCKAVSKELAFGNKKIDSNNVDVTSDGTTFLNHHSEEDGGGCGLFYINSGSKRMRNK